ncbi:MAG: UDP-N-acetylmuramoyl-L-alanyl-D-glutamate--2,6-diaminopimelate ligase [Magnetococcales bacterium]|nr:UDP-N-acetylmuramoyl-L-alanyl-D-glutamate--2,6-diaminopimelate ligase [Magnetococcales bacterium]
MLCSQLQESCPQLTRIGPDRVITAITDDSRLVQPGWLFVARPGWQQDGSHFIHDALARGAVAILQATDASWPALDPSITRLLHPQPRWALGVLAALLAGSPGAGLRTMAVTGTNGKTTTTFMLASILRQAQWPCGIIGTTGMIWPDGHIEHNPMTTPGAVQLQQCLSRMVDAGCQAVAMEVSSHALDQQRTAGLRFDVALFTNLTRDHLDYHGSEQAYFAAKAKLFQRNMSRRAVIYLDDPWSPALLAICHEQQIPAFGYRVITSPIHDGRPELVDRVITMQVTDTSWQGTHALLWHQGRSWPLYLPTIGLFNVANATAAAAAALWLGLDEDTIAAGLTAISLPPGRMQLIQAGQPFAVVVDYAHTPDALEQLLRSTRTLIAADHRVMVVFGCGGERDHAKRPMMGRVASQWADIVIVTDDNPRRENAATIRQAVLQGIDPREVVCYEIADREQAITQAMTLAQPGDVVLIAGKGHERQQVSQAGSVPFDDVQVATAVITKHQGR